MNLIANDINQDDNLDLIITYSDNLGKIYTNICLGYYDKNRMDHVLSFNKATKLINTEFVFGDFNGDRL